MTTTLVDADPVALQQARPVVIDRLAVLVSALRDAVRLVVGRFGQLVRHLEEQEERELLPGLYYNGPALFGQDYESLITTLDEDLATPEHAAFVQSSAARRAIS